MEKLSLEEKMEAIPTLGWWYCKLLEWKEGFGHRKTYIPYTINIRKFCANLGIEDRYLEIRNRILREVEAAGDRSPHVYADIRKGALGELRLDHEGIEAYQNILALYMDIDKISYLLAYTKAVNAARKFEYELKEEIRNSGIRDLYKTLALIRKSGKQQEMRNVCRWVHYAILRNVFLAR